MAGDWSPLRTNIRRDIRTMLMASRLGVTAFDVVGRLHEFWSWSQDHTSDGLLPRASTALIDAVVELPGFAEAMLEAGWLELVDDEIPFIPDWDTWNGRGAKRRLQDTKRKRDVRSESPSTTPPRPKSAACPQDVRKMSASEADKKRTTGQDSTVQKKRAEEGDAPNPSGSTHLGARGGALDSPAPEPVKKPSSKAKPKAKKRGPVDWRKLIAEPEFAALASDAAFVKAFEDFIPYREAVKGNDPWLEQTYRAQFKLALREGPARYIDALAEASERGWKGHQLGKEFSRTCRDQPRPASKPLHAHGGKMNAADAAEVWRAQRAAQGASQDGPRDVEVESPFRLLGGA